MHPEPCSLYQGLVENCPDVIWQTDRELCFCYVNNAVTTQFGYSPEELLGRPLPELLSPASRDFVLGRLAARVAEEQTGKKAGHRLLEVLILTKVGNLVPAEVSVSAIRDEAGDLVGFQGVTRNVSDRVRIEERMRLSERNYRELVERSSSFILRWTSDGIITFANSHVCEFFGFLPEELVGRHLVGTIVPEVESTGQSLRQLIAEIGANPEQFRTSEHETICWDGSRIWVAWNNSPAYNEKGQPEILSVGHDVSERRQREKQLAYLTVHDPMTGLYNRAYFDTEFERLSRGRRFPVSVVIASLDNLQLTNDEQGRERGDLILMKAARLLKEGFRAEDLVSRTGGDGFAILLPGLDEQQTAVGLIRFRAAVARASEHDPAVFFCMGASTAHTGSELLRAQREASAAMVAEKLLRKKQREQQEKEQQETQEEGTPE
ncbi:PAS domain S-box-containing protein/diguanylate cyclase (GGDEF) domain-containing protein [Trichlorobacter thiogenes]|uniref:PAS domain S-box-containing protein/diguanylate cyclase (GGDEF) domain-containing protein n=1 Tax=Trichlorobacter thiogenes TaxID=115783 RepID=A0A1T4K7M5_9BACT|nr:sensor domain-containing diguanylate cyclase [Trichlorobacter thiogenes]SJZ38315.1 PAS domain S-box-containing protein/diguanylate cyclase (GGDEF) domain-containing protein [Trichlorobacter thiogenes]